MSGQTPGAADETVAEQALQWFLRHRAGPLSQAQRKDFIGWLTRSPDHVRAYLQALHLHRQVGAAMAMDMDMDMTQRVDGALPASAPMASAKVVRLVTPPARRSAPPARRRRHRARAIAAVACSVVLLGSLLLRLSPETQVLGAGRGQLRDLELADGTRMRLNADSTVRVRMGWLERRVELLRGEASFDVAADRRPFRVRVDDLVVRDIGTVFDVARRLRNIRVGVMSGQVEIWGNGAGAARLARLDAGRVVLVDRGTHALQTLDMPASMLLDWQQRKVSFLDERLDEVAVAFNRHNAVQVIVEDDVAASMRLSGSLDAHRVEALQAFLQRDARFSVRRDGNAMHVSSR